MNIDSSVPALLNDLIATLHTWLATLFDILRQGNFMSGLYGASRPLLVLAPHPDDETFGCGGAIHLFTSAGGQADVAFMTRGECGAEMFEPISEARKQEIAEVRTAEAGEACRRWEFNDIGFSTVPTVTWRIPRALPPVCLPCCKKPNTVASFALGRSTIMATIRRRFSGSSRFWRRRIMTAMSGYTKSGGPCCRRSCCRSAVPWKPNSTPFKRTPANSKS